MIIHWNNIPLRYNIVVASETEFDIHVMAVNEGEALYLNEHQHYEIEDAKGSIAKDVCFYDGDLACFHRPKEK